MKKYVMKKCPSCYAIMHESTPVPAMQRTPTDSNHEVPAARVLYECGQCGHMEELIAKPEPALSRG